MVLLSQAEVKKSGYRIRATQKAKRMFIIVFLPNGEVIAEVLEARLPRLTAARGE